MLIEIIKDILFACSCSTPITVPLFLILLSGRLNQKMRMSKEQYKKEAALKNWDLTEKWFYIAIITGAILGALYSPIAFFGAGNTQIGSLLEKRCYEEQYFVQFRSSSRDKPYMLVADIEKTKDDDYVINKVHFENGGYISFSSMPVEPRKEEHIPADNDEWYYITLTKEKVSK